MERVISPENAEVAFGAPGINPSWQRGDKDGVGTAYSSSSRLWFTIWNGIVTEIYAPTVDRPQVRDLQLLFYRDGEFLVPEVSMNTSIERIDSSLGYCIRGTTREGPAFCFEKEIICDPHHSCLLLHVKVTGDPGFLESLKVCVLCAPHLAGSGKGNNAQVVNFIGTHVLTAEHSDEWLVLSADTPFHKTSVGYVGVSDAWTDLDRHKAMTWEFKSAPDGNVALAGEIELSSSPEFTVLLSFGQTQHSALANMLQSKALPYSQSRKRFLEQWARVSSNFEDLSSASGDGGILYQTSVRLLLAHEDKIYPGAMVASLAIPWGEARGDENGQGGYHLIWTRDLVQSALGLLAAGQTETPLRSFLYLAASQDESGRFPQNFWVNGVPFWQGLQLDEVAFPIILAHRLWKAGALGLHLIKETALRAVSFLLLAGPITGQERWEETRGLSPSTLAVLITAMICASEMAEHDGDTQEQALVEDFADWLESHIETWTVTRSGTLLPDIPEHFVRINPVAPGQSPPESLDSMQVRLKNVPPGEQDTFAANEIIDTGFLELVRYGIRRADDAIVVSSLKVVDALLRVETPSGVLWRRYNHDGYGQQVDGSSYVSFGQGRGWPLLAGERGHYELAAGRSGAECIRWMEGFATPTHLLPEQSWDAAETADGRQKPGRPTGSAVPLLWAHAEYIKLLRSERDGVLFDRNERVAARYQKEERSLPKLFLWSFGCPISSVPAAVTLRVLAESDFELTYSTDCWSTVQRLRSKRTKLRLAFADVELPAHSASAIIFTFRWLEDDRWEGRDFSIKVGG